MQIKSLQNELILASTSRYRKMLLERLGIPFSCRSPETDETGLPGESSRDLATRLAFEKASSVSLKRPAAIVIGSDQVAEFEGRIIGKPESAKNALSQLMAFSGHAVNFYSAFCVLRHEDGFRMEDCVTTHVGFRKFTEDEALRYIKLDNPLDCAGSFKSEAGGSMLLKSLQSPDPTALIGLPLIALCQCLRKAGLPLP